MEKNGASEKSLKTAKDQIELLMADFDLQLKVQSEKFPAKKEDVDNTLRQSPVQEDQIGSMSVANSWCELSDAEVQHENISPKQLDQVTNRLENVKVR